MIYSDKVMDHFKNPRNVGEIDDANGVGEVGNAKCGDIMKVYLKVEDNIIKDVKFQTFGCGYIFILSFHLLYKKLYHIKYSLNEYIILP